jgi:hypothetical protein
MQGHQSWLQLLAAAILGAFLSWIAQAKLARDVEMRQNTYQIAIVFEQEYYGGHRNKLTAFSFKPEILALVRTEKPEKDFYEVMLKAVEHEIDVKVSILAIADFYRTLNRCVEAERCKISDIQQFFSAYAKEFYDLFFPVLRDAHCRFGFPEAEANVARVAKITISKAAQCAS